MGIPRSTPAPAGATNKRVVSMKSQEFKLWMLLAVVAAGLLSPAVQAQQTFRAYGGLALTQYSIKFDNNAPNFGGAGDFRNKTAKADYLAPTIGFTWVSPQRIYVDASYQTSLSAEHDLWKDFGFEAGLFALQLHGDGRLCPCAFRRNHHLGLRRPDRR